MLFSKTYSSPPAASHARPVRRTPEKEHAEITNGGPPAETVGPEVVDTGIAHPEIAPKPRDTGPPPARRRPSRPSTNRSHPASGQLASDREAKADYRWAILVGSILALAALREGFRRAKPPAAAAAATAKSVSRSHAAFGIAVLVRLLARIGATSLGRAA